LSDDRTTVLKYFPLEGIYHEMVSGTRSSIHWLDQEGDKVEGEVTFYFKNRELFQLVWASPSFKTIGGTTLRSKPDALKKRYSNLSAFLLWKSGGKGVGSRDLILWVSQEFGIAFELYYDRREHRRLVGNIYIFSPGIEFFPGETWLPLERWYGKRFVCQ
jgi:hypothetical protein